RRGARRALCRRARGARAEHGGVRHNRGRGAGGRTPGDRRRCGGLSRDGDRRTDGTPGRAGRRRVLRRGDQGDRRARFRPGPRGAERGTLLRRRVPKEDLRARQAGARTALVRRDRGRWPLLESPPVAATKPLRIAWLGSSPLDTGGVPGVVEELLEGLAELGHEIDCFFPGSGEFVSARLVDRGNPTFIWGMSGWSWNRWYSRSGIAAFISGLISRAASSMRLRREITRRHRKRPYDVIFQNSTIESLGVPAGVVRTVPLVIHPQTHIAGELRWLIAERRLAFASQPRHIFFANLALMSLRALVQRVRIQR